MDRSSVVTILESLNADNVRYLVVGGLAVVAHGHVRFTADVDLVLNLTDENVQAAIAALSALGYTPRAPVPIEQFADPAVRQQWMHDKGMTVFSLFSSQHPATEVDLFVEEPLDFDSTYARAARIEFAPGVSATVVSYDDLLELKRRAGRAQDLDDIQRLEEIHREQNHG